MSVGMQRTGRVGTFVTLLAVVVGGSLFDWLTGRRTAQGACPYMGCYGIKATVPLGPTTNAPPSGYGLTALKAKPCFFLPFMRRGFLGGRKAEKKVSPMKKKSWGAAG